MEKSRAAKSGRYSRNKGKRGERQWRDFLKSHGFNARRGQQFSGEEGRDVICEGMPEIHHEVKYQEAVPKKIYDYLFQAKRDAKELIPIVALRRNNYDWAIVMDADDFIKIIKESTYVNTVFCKHCQAANYKKKGYTVKSKQRYLCFNCNHSFI